MLKRQKSTRFRMGNGVIFGIMSIFILFFGLMMPDAFGRCDDLSCTSPPNSDLKLINFSYVYYTADPIQFILEKPLDDDCNSYNAKIVDHDGGSIWRGGAEVSCDSDFISTISQVKIGYSENHPIFINTPGKYFLEVEFSTSSLIQEFVVEPNSFGHVLEVNDLYSGFFTDADTRLSHYIFESGSKINFRQQIDNNSTNSEQNGTLDFYFHSSQPQTTEFLESFDFNIRPYTYDIFEINYTPEESGFFEIEIVPTMTEPYNLGGYSYLFSVVDEHSLAYEKYRGCDENFRSVIKPDYSTVMCVNDDTLSKLLQRGWHKY